MYGAKPSVVNDLFSWRQKKNKDFFVGSRFSDTAGMIPLLAVDIACPLFDNLLWRPAATVMPLP